MIQKTNQKARKEMSRGRRICIDLSPEEATQFDEIIAGSRLRHGTAVVREALDFLYTCAEAQAKGYALVLQKKGRPDKEIQALNVNF